LSFGIIDRKKPTGKRKMIYIDLLNYELDVTIIVLAVFKFGGSISQSYRSGRNGKYGLMEDSSKRLNSV
jgi:hypothetical protein